MKRTQIYLPEDMMRQLKKESKRSGKTISAIIRERIQMSGKKGVSRIVTAAEEACGAWKNRSSDVNRDIRKLRRDRTV